MCFIPNLKAFCPHPGSNLNKEPAHRKSLASSERIFAENSEVSSAPVTENLEKFINLFQTPTQFQSTNPESSIVINESRISQLQTFKHSNFQHESALYAVSKVGMPTSANATQTPPPKQSMNQESSIVTHKSRISQIQNREHSRIYHESALYAVSKKCLSTLESATQTQESSSKTAESAQESMITNPASNLIQILIQSNANDSILHENEKLNIQSSSPTLHSKNFIYSNLIESSYNSSICAIQSNIKSNNKNATSHSKTFKKSSNIVDNSVCNSTSLVHNILDCISFVRFEFSSSSISIKSSQNVA